MIAVKITDEWRTATVGAPAYLARRGTPKAPEDLAEHNCIRLRLPNGALLPWRFQKGGKSYEIVGQRLAHPQRSIADGAGAARRRRPCATAARLCRHGIANGGLVSLLEEWQPSGAPFALYYSSRRQTPAALQALIDFLRKGQRGRNSR